MKCYRSNDVRVSGKSHKSADRFFDFGVSDEMGIPVGMIAMEYKRVVSPVDCNGSVSNDGYYFRPDGELYGYRIIDGVPCQEFSVIAVSSIDGVDVGPAIISEYAPSLEAAYRSIMPKIEMAKKMAVKKWKYFDVCELAIS